MKDETKCFLEFVDKDLIPEKLNLALWNQYIENLPWYYNNDLTFRLLFDWHVQAFNRIGRAWFISDKTHNQDEIFTKQISLINGVARLYGLTYQYRELILFHARVDLKGKRLLEIGGALPPKLVFDELGVAEYINIESKDYIESEKGVAYSATYGKHERQRTIICNAEELSSQLEEGSIDSIFSVACFEHIYDLKAALVESHKCLRKGGTLFSYFSPIYSYLIEGDHGVIPDHPKLRGEEKGFHLLSLEHQRITLLNSGINDPKEIQDFLGNVNFNRVPNRLRYEDYERILTESPFYVLELDRQEALNMSKTNSKIVSKIRASNSFVGNMMTAGFRVYLMKY